MKNIITTILLLAFCTAQAQVKLNLKDLQGNRHGLWEKKHPNGNVRYTGKFDHGIPVGKFKHYYENGKLQATNSFRGTTGNCYSKQHGDDEKLAAEGKYVQGKKDSIWTYYNYNGDIVSRETYKNGLKEGIAYTYYPDGSIAEEVTYVNDVKSGPWKQFYKNGKPKAHGSYVDGSLSGEVTYFSIKGKPRAKGKYVKGRMHGKWYYFEEANHFTVEKKEIWRYGKLLETKEYTKKKEEKKEN